MKKIRLYAFGIVSTMLFAIPIMLGSSANEARNLSVDACAVSNGGPGSCCPRNAVCVTRRRE